MSQSAEIVAPRRPRLLDLFCRAGGASMGYWRAGFDIVGVDIEPRPDYPEMREFEAEHPAPRLADFMRELSRGAWNGAPA